MGGISRLAIAFTLKMEILKHNFIANMRTIVIPLAAVDHVFSHNLGRIFESRAQNNWIINMMRTFSRCKSISVESL